MEAASEGDNDRNNSGEPKKPKRQMKTPYQLEVLEMTYAAEKYPPEPTRLELSKKLDLTDRQLQMWFCHRRLKDKKDSGQKKDVMATVPVDAERGNGHGSGSGSGSGSRSQSEFGDVGYEDEEVPMMRKSYYESPSSLLVRRVIACVEEQLGERVREDGPILGMEFEQLPPGAFGAPIEQPEQSEDLYRNESLEQYNYAPTKVKPLAYMAMDYDERDALVNHPSIKEEYPDQSYTGSGQEKKRKFDEIRDLKQYENQDKRSRKELDREDVVRRKREEQMRREMDRQERERRKDEERMNRERQRLQEKIQREERRENERREKQLQKESLKAERRNKIEELRREKEEARQRAALERASARKIAKESMELIDDERLELMELAASSKKLSSIVSLDYDTLQNLEAFRDLLCSFPPKSVQLKKPFTTIPWTDSDENIGNLLMVWKFCISFIDVLEIMPFTLDEFVQALHDYDSRLLREIHISLLKLIVRDIEDVARTPSGVLGTNQWSNTEGGHSRIVEGAYLWGFDICTWKNHLNPLTWPEILRQLALSAGFGPQLKKKSMSRSHTQDNDEAKGSADVVSILRNGSAAVNAAAAMQEKGSSLQRKSRHRLTPGTVKFAAYHVLALEGNAGLNVVDLAHKIQKSGLRDLSSSKTPEASISVALSRDGVLFERTAPSTYRVRPPFQKDPADAETLLATAREKIKRFENGFLAADNVEDVDRDEELEGEGAESPEVDDFDTANAKSYSGVCNEVIASLGKEKEDMLGNGTIYLKKETHAAGSCDDVFVDDAGGDNCSSNDVDTEVDESRDGQTWVLGLMEGEYSDLSIEERLQALVALVGIVNEGNYIRAVLENRLDAASTLKKQKWAEAQLDKKRVREEGATKPNETEAKHYSAAVDSIRSPGAAANNNECSLNSAVKEPCAGNDSMMGHLSNSPLEKNLEERDVSVCKISSSIHQNGYSAERSRLQMKSYVSYRSEEVYVCRSLPLGQDRRRNRYWQFIVSSEKHDPGSGRIFVESPGGLWKLIDTKEAFDALLTSLDVRGIRESHLHIVLQNIEKSFKETVSMNSHHTCSEDGSGRVGYNTVGKDESSNFSGYKPLSSRIGLGDDEVEKRAAMVRYRELQTWIWKECFSSSILCAMRYGNKRCGPVLGICDVCHDVNVVEIDFCRSCYRPIGTSVSEPLSTFGEERKVNFKDPNVWKSIHSLAFRLLKALLTIIEVTVPHEGLQSSWMENCRKSWGMKLQASSSADDLLQVMIELESVIRRDQLSAMFETTEELVASNSRYRLGSSSIAIPELLWIPPTTAAVALRLFELDASISYIFDEKKTSELHQNKQLASYTVEQAEVSKGFKVKSSRKLAGSNGSSSQKKKVRGGYRGRLQKRVISGRLDQKDDHPYTELLWQKGQPLVPGQRTVSKRRIKEEAGQDMIMDRMVENSSKSGRNQWAAPMETEDNNFTNRLDEVESESEEDDGGAVGFEFRKWDNGYSEQMNDEDVYSSEGDDDLEEDNGRNNARDERGYLHLPHEMSEDSEEEDEVRNEDESDSGDSDGYED